MRDFQQFDNVNRVIDDLKVSLASSSRISIEAATFSIYAYQALKDELEKIDDFRFIFTSPTFIKDKVKKVFLLPNRGPKKGTKLYLPPIFFRPVVKFPPQIRPATRPFCRFLLNLPSPPDVVFLGNRARTAHKKEIIMSLRDGTTAA